MKKISIVMTAYNRNKQLDHTLHTVTKSKMAKNTEIIIVDDASKEPITKVVNKYKDQLDIKPIYISKQNKWWINPCIPYNIGFGKATGDIVVIQNAEVVHIGDVLSFIHDNLKENQYMCMGCYSLGSFVENDVYMNLVNSSKSPEKAALEYIKMKGDFVCPNREVGGWYVNTKHFTGLHYLTAIYKKDLDRIGGFSPEFAMGYRHDDDEFIRRIWYKKLDIIHPDVYAGYPFGTHLYHTYHSYASRKTKDFIDKWKLNNRVFNRLVDKYGFKGLTPFMNKTLPHTVI